MFSIRSNDCCGGCCCSIDVWGIALNIVLQDAPFLAFRMLIIIHYRIISYMNVFFTCTLSEVNISKLISIKNNLRCSIGKNTLVILLQLYRLYVVHSENKANEKKKMLDSLKANSRKRNDLNEMNQFNDIYIISSGKLDKRRSKRFACSYENNGFITHFYLFICIIFHPAASAYIFAPWISSVIFSSYFSKYPNITNP